MKRICVYCGSRFGGRESYRETAEEMGRLLAEEGLGVVYGGGKVGLMGAVARSALGAGGEVIGVIPEMLKTREVAHTDLTELHVVQTMHERKALMAELTGAFMALPGGLGTMEEIFEALTWFQIGIHDKPCGLLNVEGYYDPLLAFIDRQVAEGFVPPSDRERVIVEREPRVLLDRMLQRWRELSGGD